MNGKHVNETTKIVILPSAVRAVYSEDDLGRIQRTLREGLLLKTRRPYHKVQARVLHRPDGSPEALIAYMLRAYTYTADIVRVNVDGSYAYTSEEALSAEVALPPAPSPLPPLRPPLVPQMVFGTPVPEIPTARKAVDVACQIATQAGFKVKKLLGPEASVANYQRYLTSHLLAFGNVGHGFTGGIVLDDGNLTSSWFSAQASKALSPEVIYFNSCQTFNAPLQPSIMAAGARTFIGGIINLLIGASEEVFKCFWKTVLTSSRPMGLALRGCEKANYPVANAHGISGDMGKFKAGFVVPAKVKEKPKAKATGAAKSGAKGKGAAKSRAKAKGAAKATGKAKAKGKPRKGAKSTKGR